MISVLVPRAGNCPHRARAWEWVRDQYPYEVIEGWAAEHAWSKAAAVHDALTRASGDLLIIADADCWSPNLPAAIEAVESGAPWSAPHLHVRRLTERGTEQFIAGAREEAELEESHFAKAGGGITVLSRATYERIPLDPRFVGWGGEDIAWADALVTLAGNPALFHAEVWHLWHPPQARMSRTIGNEANEALRQRYHQARRQPGPMRVIVEEARECLFNGSSPRQSPSSNPAR